MRQETNIKHTRKQYLNKECSHDDYYSQFVNDGIIRTVLMSIGADRIENSSCEHFNNIPLKEWAIVFYNGFPQPAAKMLREAGDFPTLAGAVCLAKTAARMHLERKKG